MFPVELLTEICFALGTGELLLLSSMNKAWNEAAMIALYRDIDIERPRAIWKCVQTLSLPPGMLSFGRDYCLYPQSIRLRHPLLIQIHPESKEALAESLMQLLPRLINLLSFSCGIPLPYVPRVFQCLSTNHNPGLRALELTSDARITESDTDKFESAVPRGNWLTLSSLKLKLTGLKLKPGGSLETEQAAPYLSFLKCTIFRSPDDLRVLSLDVGTANVVTRAPIENLFRCSLPVFAGLTELSIPAEWITFTCFAQAPELKALHVFGLVESLPILRPSEYPALEELSYATDTYWHADLLGQFLPDVQAPRRPIHTLRLGHASYERHGGTYVGAINRESVLAPIAYSEVPLQSLSISIADHRIRELCNWETMRYLAHLKSLVMVVHMNYGDTVRLCVPPSRHSPADACCPTARLGLARPSAPRAHATPTHVPPLGRVPEEVRSRQCVPMGTRRGAAERGACRLRITCACAAPRGVHDRVRVGEARRWAVARVGTRLSRASDAAWMAGEARGLGTVSYAPSGNILYVTAQQRFAQFTRSCRARGSILAETPHSHVKPRRLCSTDSR